MRKLYDGRERDACQTLTEKSHPITKNFMLSCQGEIVTLFHGLF